MSSTLAFPVKTLTPTDSLVGFQGTAPGDERTFVPGAAGALVFSGATAAAIRTTLELGNVNNTSDASKPVSTATQTALNAKLTAASNLSDLTNASTARTNLGLGSLATQSGTFSGTSSGTNTGDQNLSGLLVKSANLSDLTNASTARTNLGLGSLATQSGTFSGTSSGTNTGDQNLSGLLVKASNLSDLTSASTARTNLGLGTAATRNVGQAPGNVLEYSGLNAIAVGDGGAPGAYVNLLGPDGIVSVSNDGGQLIFSDASATVSLGQLALLSQVGDRYLTSSTTSNTVGNGAKTFTVGTGLAYTPTQDITIVFNAANHMHAGVTSYNSATGALVVDVNSHTGSGTYAVWTVNVGGIGAGAIPSGGTTGQVLAKVSATNYDDAWVTPSVAVGGVTGLGTGVATALAVNAGSAGSFVRTTDQGTAATRNVGQATGNLLELSGQSTISLGVSTSGLNGYLQLYDNDAESFSNVNSVGGSLYANGSRLAFLGEIPDIDPLQTKAVIVNTTETVTAEPDGVYTIALPGVLDNVLIGDFSSSGSNGKGYTVIVRRGSVSIDGIPYSVAGTVIRRIYRSGWATYIYSPAGPYGTGVVTALRINAGSTGAFVRTTDTATTTTAGVVPTLGSTTDRAGAPIRRQLLVSNSNQFTYRVLGAWLNNAATSGTGTAISSETAGNVRLTSGASAGARSGVPTGSFAFGAWNGNYVVSDWGLTFFASGTMSIFHTGTAASDTRIRSGIGKSSASLGQISARGFMIEVQWNGTNYEVFCAVHNGTVLNIQTTGITFATQRTVLWSVEADGLGNAVWYVSVGGTAPFNGQTRSNATLTQTGAPTGVETTTRYPFVEINNGASGGASITVDFHPMTFSFGI